MGRLSDRLVELDFPVAGVSTASVGEKSVRHGHISTLQQWFARRPLAVCRATIFAALLDAPDDLDLGPALRARLSEMVGADESLTEQLSRFVTRLARWDSVRDPDVIGLARDLLVASGRQDALVVDTYAGGGSVPLEALRLGLRANASDLHPVATTAMRLALGTLPGRPDLVDAYREASAVVANRLDQTLAAHYADAGEPSVLADFWARTCTCPSCGGEMPLVRTWWLARGRRPIVATPRTDGRGGWCVDIGAPRASADGVEGTWGGRVATCIHCKHGVTTAHLRAEGVAGRLSEVLYARLELDGAQRVYRAIEERDLVRLRALPTNVPDLLHDVTFDFNGVRHTWAMQYGMLRTSDLHNPRQLFALGTVAEAVATIRDELPTADADPLTIALMLTLNRLIPYSTRCTWWQPSGEFPANMFSRQAIPMVWNYVEIPVTSPAAAGWRSATRWLVQVFNHCAELPRAATVRTGDAGTTKLRAASADLFVLDPPYFDAIAYSYLADPFYAWNRGLMQAVSGDEFAPTTVDRSREAIVDRRHGLAPGAKDGEHFRQRLTEGLSEARRCLSDDGRLVLMYGHPRLEAWEALIEAVLEAGFAVVRSWPIHTERKVKFRHGRINALSTSAILVCRKRVATELPAMTLDDFEHRLAGQLDGWLRELNATDVLGGDLQGAIASGSAPLICAHRVVDSDGQPIGAGTLLGSIPRLLQRKALEGRGSTAVSAALADELVTWANNGRISWLTLSGRHAELDAAIAVTLLLHADKAAEADRRWRALSLAAREAVTEVVSFVAATAQLAADRRMAEAVLGRVSLHRRLALAGHRPEPATARALLRRGRGESQQIRGDDPGSGERRDQVTVSGGQLLRDDEVQLDARSSRKKDARSAVDLGTPPVVGARRE